MRCSSCPTIESRSGRDRADGSGCGSSSESPNALGTAGRAARATKAVNACAHLVPKLAVRCGSGVVGYQLCQGDCRSLGQLLLRRMRVRGGSSGQAGASGKGGNAGTAGSAGGAGSNAGTGGTAGSGGTSGTGWQRRVRRYRRDRRVRHGLHTRRQAMRWADTADVRFLRHLAGRYGVPMGCANGTCTMGAWRAWSEAMRWADTADVRFLLRLARRHAMSVMPVWRGNCTGVCTPASQQCNGLIPQTCDGPVHAERHGVPVCV